MANAWGSRERRDWLVRMAVPPPPPEAEVLAEEPPAAASERSLSWRVASRPRLRREGMVGRAKQNAKIDGEQSSARVILSVMTWKHNKRNHPLSVMLLNIYAAIHATIL